MVILGAILVAFSVGSMVTHFSLPLSPTVLGVLGGFLLVLGLFFTVVELIEGWLSKGQAALVDGLQAG